MEEILKEDEKKKKNIIPSKTQKICKKKKYIIFIKTLTTKVFY